MVVFPITLQPHFSNLCCMGTRELTSIQSKTNIAGRPRRESFTVKWLPNILQLAWKEATEEKSQLTRKWYTKETRVGGLPIGIKDIKRGARKVVISSKMKYTYKLYWIEVGWKEEVDVLKTWQDHQQDEVEYENEE